jgi:hypothetical protein
MSDDPKPTARPDPSAPRRFSRRRLLASAGATLGAFTLSARPKQSAYWYRDVISRNGLT